VGVERGVSRMGRVLGGEILGARKAGVFGGCMENGGCGLDGRRWLFLLWVLGFGGSFRVHQLEPNALRTLGTAASDSQCRVWTTTFLVLQKPGRGLASCDDVEAQATSRDERPIWLSQHELISTSQTNGIIDIAPTNSKTISPPIYIS